MIPDQESLIYCAVDHDQIQNHDICQQYYFPNIIKISTKYILQQMIASNDFLK